MSTELATILANNPLMIQTGVDEDTAAVAGGGATESLDQQMGEVTFPSSYVPS